MNRGNEETKAVLQCTDRWYVSKRGQLGHGVMTPVYINRKIRDDLKKLLIGVGENCLIVSSHRNIHNKSVFDKTYTTV